MNTQLKRLVALSGLAAALMLASSGSAFALGKSHHSGYRGWTNSGSTNSGSVVNEQPTGDTPAGDSNPTPEPASMLLFGSALAGAAGYRKVKARFSKKA